MYNYLLSKLVMCLLLVAIFATTFVCANAAYLRFEPQTVTQPDGEVLNFFASGDEYFNWMHDKDGFTIIRDSKGYYCYGTKSGDIIVPTSYHVGKVNPESVGLIKWATPSVDYVNSKRIDFNKTMVKEKKNKNRTQTSNIGTIQNIVIYIRFAGESEFTDATSTYNALFNATSGSSMYTYFREVSYNNLTINTSFFPIAGGSTVVSFQDSHNRNYFKVYDPTLNPTGYNGNTERTNREHALLKAAVDGVSSQIPSNLAIDNDNDGYVDNVCFIISGAAEGWSELLWPHRWSLYSQTAYINGKVVADYNFQLRNSLQSSGVGVLCHEMFHTLGAPDLYHYSGQTLNPVGSWDIMEYNTNPPQHMSAFMKWKYGGWISSIPTISTNGSYSLNPLTTSSGNCYRINSPNSSTEYYVVEFRKKTGTFESSIPGSGLLVYRINTAAGDGNASGPPDEVYVYRPGGTVSVNGNFPTANLSSDVSRTAINATTDPTPFLSDGSPGGLDINTVGSYAGSTISFNLGTGSSLAAPTLTAPANNAFAQSVTPSFTWNSVPSATTYKLQVSVSRNFTTKAIDLTGLTGTSYNVPTPLATGTTYYWRMQAVNASTTSNWSDTLSFTTVMDKPSLIYPANNQKGIQITDTLTWMQVNGASDYRVQVSTSPVFTTTIIDVMPSNTFQPLSGILSNNTVYYWRVRASSTSPTNNSLWSDTLSFTTAIAPPTLSLPQDNAVNVNILDTVRWTTVATAITYSVQIALDANFTSPIVDQSALSSNFYPFSGLTYATKYYWRARATNANGASVWSSPYSFTTVLAPPNPVSPADSAKMIQLVGPLRWTKVPSATKYWLQVSTSKDFALKTIDEANITDSVFACSGLQNKTKYFWRVLGRNTNSQSAWSSIRMITTVIGAPHIPMPADSARNVVSAGQLIWDGVTGATKYKLELSKFEDFNGPKIIDTLTSSTSFNYSGLDSSSTFYWRLQAQDAEETGLWSDTWQFSTVMGQPKLIYPDDNAQGVAETPALIWRTVPSATSYNVQVSLLANFSTKLKDTTNIKDTTMALKGLLTGTKYYWKVQAKNAGGTSPWSSVYSYTVASGQPTLLAPANSAINIPISGTLQWNALRNATSYRLMVADNSGFNNPIIDQSGITGTSGNYADLSYYKKYNWRISAVVNGQTTDWSEVRSFTTIVATPTIADFSSQMISCSDIFGSIKWSSVADAATYSMQISSKSDFSIKEIDQNNISSTESTFSGLKYNTLYNVRTKAVNSGSTGDWSAPKTFTTKPDKASLVFPSKDTTNIQLTGRITFKAKEGATLAKIQLAKTDDFALPLVDESGVTNAYYDYPKLEKLTKYYWRVQSSKGACMADWSETWSFTTGSFVDIDENNPTQYLNIFPNPSDGNSVIQFNAEPNSHVSISLYNSLGDKIELPIISGSNRIELKPYNLSSGVYHLVMMNGTNIITRQFIIQK